MEATFRAADSLQDAAREMRRNTARRFSRWEKILLFVFAAVTTGCSVVAAVAVLTG